MSRRIVLVAAAAFILAGCMNAVATRVIQSQNDGGYPVLTDPLLLSYQQRYLKLRPTVEANPAKFFGPVGAIPCDVPQEIKEQLVLDGTQAAFKEANAGLGATWQLDKLEFSLLEGNCNGGKPTGLVTYVGSSSATTTYNGTINHGLVGQSNGMRRVTVQLLDGRQAGPREMVRWVEQLKVSMNGVKISGKPTGMSAADSLASAPILSFLFDEARDDKPTGSSAIFSYASGAELGFTSTAINELVSSGKFVKFSSYSGSRLTTVSHRVAATGVPQGPAVMYIKGLDGQVTEMVQCYQNGELVKSVTCPLE